MKKKKKEKPLTRAKAKVRIQKTQTNPALVDLKRQLRIEASLDRVRRKALSMKKPDDLLNICKTLYTELQLLGFDELRNSIINIHNDDNESIVNYDCAKTGASINHFTYRVHPAIESLVRQMKSGRAAFSEGVMTGKKLKEFFKAFRKSHGEKIDAEIRNAKALYYYFYSTGTGALGISNLVPLGAGQLKILKRFRNVFDLAYRRYTDIQKAEAQAREAQIEAALEKVRSRSLAMHKSDELREVVKAVFDKLLELNFVLEDGAVTIIIFKEHSRDHTQWIADPGHSYATPFELAYSDHSIPRDVFRAKEGGADYFSKIYPTEEKNGYFNYLFANSSYKYLPPEIKELILGSSQYGFSIAFTKHAAIFVPTNSGRLLTESEKEILKRFARVFEQTYTRFLDLQKAEAQTRESQIQLALERVRARTMAMHRSSELSEAASLLFEQLTQLGAALWTCGFAIYEKDKAMVEKWMSSPDSGKMLDPLYFPYSADALEQMIYEKWKNGAELYTEVSEGAEIWKNQEQLNIAVPALKAVLESLFASGIPFPDWVKAHAAFHKYGYLLIITTKPFEETHVFVRFAKVFEQTYTRFLDLQKAEAQAREAQIEAALEKVRSRSLAMHHSDELKEVVATIFEKLKELGLVFDGGAGVKIFSEGSKDTVLWVAVADAMSVPPSRVNLPYVEDIFLRNAMHLDIWQARENNTHLFNRTYSLEDKNEYFNYTFAHNDFTAVPQSIRDYIMQAPSYTGSEAYEKNTAVVVSSFSGELISEKQFEILKRFSRVFEQAYTRFLDLQKAEAQAREAQIEASLERVRARTMAMQKSDELSDVASLMFQQVKELGITAWTIGFNVWSDDNNKYTDYITSPLGGFVEPYTIDTTLFPAGRQISDAKKRGEDFYVQHLEGELLRETYLELSKFGDKDQYVKIREGGFEFPIRQFDHFVFLSNISLMFITYDPVPEAHDVFKRFGKVFEQTYTRFLDLQKAEVQAREAKLEASLERVRGKAMAMHNSNDVSSAASMVFTELRKLGITPIRCGVGLLNKESRKAQLYSATSSNDGDSLSLVGWVELSGHPVLKNIYDTWLNNEDYFPELSGEQLKSYYERLLTGLSVKVPDWQSGQKQYGTFLQFSVGCLYAWSDVPYNDAEIKILKRFANIIDLTFRRYIELQKSEANAKEAVKQAALDRIRADIASMRTISDLDRITPLIWNELTILGLPFIRCGVFIMDDIHEQVHTFLSTPEGKAIAAFHLDYAVSNLKEAIRHWHDRQVYVTHWGEKEFGELAGILLKQGSISSLDQYLNTLPTGGIYLHFLPFMQGMLYVGNTTQLQQEDIHLLQSLAEAFSTAYARYEDFSKLEVAKQQVDKTLVDLKQAQQQLVQSEKMASLGELTAGIAHEIQNPLNFVNNFAEVSNELIDEMVEEVKKGNFDEAKVIANDLRQNLEKINHHGKRADGIVKSMLQHSRTSSGQKELTDINVLCDEYLRLSYHGLRAKDKSFNAKFETDFDSTLEKINVIPQDIGRVILNLINNAFYAVTEKRNADLDGYEPTVSVSTKQRDDKVEITVTDNGNGISQKVLDKIFQPFFTTKPTGQGTGLGLSLSYDIVKAHGGELKVETREGVGTEFSIQLPML